MSSCKSIENSTIINDVKVMNNDYDSRVIQEMRMIIYFLIQLIAFSLMMFIMAPVNS